MKDILFSILSGAHGEIGHIHLNRPQALNACTLPMFEEIGRHLKIWENKSNIQALWITGEGEKAFCAGGDIRSLYDNKNHPEKSIDFFTKEYAVNLSIAQFKKPYIAWLNGITMGGGLGLSIHGSHRIVTENTVIAMPETAIGLFPDVGGGYFLSRLANSLGYYLGLTGARLPARDVFETGLATHFIEQKNKAAVLEALLNLNYTDDPKLAVTHCLDNFQITNDALKKYPTQFADNLASINFCFSKPSVSEIIAALKNCNNDWAIQTLKALAKASPTSLLITFEELQRGKNNNMSEEMAMELNLVKKIVYQLDLYEGIRAAIIDKDKNPQWQPQTLEQVDPTQIATYFFDA